MYKATLATLPIAAISPPPNYCQSMNILASFWFISQLAGILLHYWSPVSPAEFNCFRVSTPPSFLLLFLSYSLAFFLLLTFHSL